MASTKPESTKGKTGRKKLKLSKETLKDLTTSDAGTKHVVGGGYNTKWCSF
jgi:hypothetical protein